MSNEIIEEELKWFKLFECVLKKMFELVEIFV